LPPISRDLAITEPMYKRPRLQVYGKFVRCL
jgi:hypothetical protein